MRRSGLPRHERRPDDGLNTSTFGESAAVCMIGQVAAGALFGFLLGALGIIIVSFFFSSRTDDSIRSIPWLLCTAVGTALGLAAGRGAGNPPSDSSEPGRVAPCVAARRKALNAALPFPALQRLPPEIVEAALSLWAALKALTLYWMFMPTLLWDHAAASTAAAVAGWAALEFGSVPLQFLGGVIGLISGRAGKVADAAAGATALRDMSSPSQTRSSGGGQFAGRNALPGGSGDDGSGGSAGAGTSDEEPPFAPLASPSYTASLHYRHHMHEAQSGSDPAAAAAATVHTHVPTLTV